MSTAATASKSKTSTKAPAVKGTTKGQATTTALKSKSKDVAVTAATTATKAPKPLRRDQIAERAAALFGHASNATTLELIARMEERPLSAAEINSEYEPEEGETATPVQILMRAKIAEVRKDGKERTYAPTERAKLMWATAQLLAAK